MEYRTLTGSGGFFIFYSIPNQYPTPRTVWMTYSRKRRLFFPAQKTDIDVDGVRAHRQNHNPTRFPRESPATEPALCQEKVMQQIELRLVSPTAAVDRRGRRLGSSCRRPAERSSLSVLRCFFAARCGCGPGVPRSQGLRDIIIRAQVQPETLSVTLSRAVTIITGTEELRRYPPQDLQPFSSGSMISSKSGQTVPRGPVAARAAIEGLFHV